MSGSGRVQGFRETKALSFLGWHESSSDGSRMLAAPHRVLGAAAGSTDGSRMWAALRAVATVVVNIVEQAARWASGQQTGGSDVCRLAQLAASAVLALQLALQPRDQGSRLTRLPCCCGGSGCVSCRLQEGDERSTFCSRCSSVFRSTSLLMTSRAGQSRVSPAEAQEGACECSCWLDGRCCVRSHFRASRACRRAVGAHSCPHTDTQMKSSLLCCPNGCLINTLNECRIHALPRGCGGSIGRSPCAALCISHMTARRRQRVFQALLLRAYHQSSVGQR